MPEPIWPVNESTKSLIGGLGTAAILCLWLSPIQTIWLAKDSVFRTGTTAGVATGFPYVASVFNCVLWLMYGIPQMEDFFIPNITNSVGLFLNISFVTCFYFYSETARQKATLQQIVAFSCVVGLGLMVWPLIGLQMVGYLAAGVNIFMLGGPLAAAQQVVRGRSTRGFPFLPLLLTELASAAWFSYGLYIMDVPVMIPNGLGMVFGVLQMSLWCWAKGQEKKSPSKEVFFDENASIASNTSVGEVVLTDEGVADVERGTVRLTRPSIRSASIAPDMSEESSNVRYAGGDLVGISPRSGHRSASIAPDLGEETRAYGEGARDVVALQ